MKRIQTTPRPDYKDKLKDLSFEFHDINDEVYWDESAYYQFSMDQVNVLETATNELWKMCLEAVQHVIDHDLYDDLWINRELIPLIERSWNEEEPSVYGRFDLAWNGVQGTFPKMLEFNADTPTSLYEAAVVQWYWLQDVDKNKDQFNSIHERLIEYWKGCADYFNGEIVHFACQKSPVVEDFTTTEYMRDTAHQAGLNTKFVYIEDIGWNEEDGIFGDLEGKPIENLFKLYPWEWLIEEDFGRQILEDDNETRWIEPAWKAILSNKGILPILWKLFPDSPYLLESYFDTPKKMTDYVIKPIYSREGANIEIYDNKTLVYETQGEYGVEEDSFVYQQKYDVHNLDGNYPIIGSWVIGGESAGIGMRESDKLVTDNLSRFIPHLIA